MRKIPPLNSLRAFEAAARLQSYTLAANELSVTQGAVSKQIKILENHVGKRLFNREFQGVSLTECGRDYFDAIAHIFKDIAAATETLVYGQQSGAIRLNALPTLSQRWLMPKLAAFQRAYPLINIDLTSGDGDVDFTLDKNHGHAIYDIAIRTIHQSHRSRVPQSAALMPVMKEELLPVCSPSYLEAQNHDEYGELSIHGLTLLQHGTRPNMWTEYFSQTAILSDGKFTHLLKHSIVFEHFFMLIEAAICGQGVALVPKVLIKDELNKKTLTVAIKNNFISPYQYYFIYRRELQNNDAIQSFLRWFTN